MSGRACTVGRIKSFFPVCLPCVTACSIYGSGGQTRLSAYGSKEQWKKKNRQKPVKAPLWHKHKRNGPCIISLNCCLGVRQSPFLRLCSSRHTFVQNPFGRWCVDRQKTILRNVVMFILVIFIIIIIKTRQSFCHSDYLC